MTNSLVFPIIVPFAAAALNLLVWRKPSAQPLISLIGAAAHLIASIAVLAAVAGHGIQVIQAGGWPSPFGITLVADHLSALMLVITGIISTASAVYAHGEMDRRLRSNGFHVLFHVLIGGVSGAFLTGDLFNLYVWFEVMLMASFGLLIWEQTREQFKAAVTYVVINLLATLLFLMGLALLYRLTGTLNMAHLHQILSTNETDGVVTVVAFVLMAAFGIKAGVFPLFFWLPAAYPTPPVAISALFAGLLTKVGVYALLRSFTLVFHHDIPVTHGALLIVACLTMITGVLGAAAQNEFRRILSFHIISQVGYMVLGLALLTPLALTGAIFYLIHHMIVKANLFLISGLSRDWTGSMQLDRMGGIYRRQPLLAVLFIIPAFSLAGFPPLSGFWAKLLIIQSGLQVGRYAIVAVAVGVGLMTIYSMVKIWIEAFWSPGPSPGPRNRQPSLSPWKVIPVSVLALLTLGIGIGAEPIFKLAAAAANELISPEHYVRAVLQGEL
jgi:multicomponent Na+:H+ antiporter subunit D